MVRERMKGWVDALFAPVDGASVAFFRVVYASIMVWEVCRYASFGWIDKYYIQPEFHFKYYGFEWIDPWPGVGMYIHYAFVGVVALLAALGWWTRGAFVLLFLSFGYIFLLEQAQYLNHLYLAVMVAGLLAFLPLDHDFSVKAWLRPKHRSRTVPAWTVWILRFQIGVVYFYAGLAKLNWDWLRGQPMTRWMASRSDMPVVGPLLGEPTTGWVMSYSGLALDLLIVPFLLWKRTRMWAFTAAICFHLMNDFLFTIGIFPWMMIAATTIFLDPDWPRRAWPGLVRRLQAPDRPAEQAPPRFSPRRVVLVLGGLFCAYQLLFPLRHFLYPGNPSWTEEGHRYAWHMKLRNKSGSATFNLRDPVSGEEWKVDPKDELTDRQARKLRSRPDMILQYAHHLAERARAEGRGDVEVRVRVFAALNGRKRQLLIDPTRDLVPIERDLFHADWILPLEEPLPGWDW